MLLTHNFFAKNNRPKCWTTFIKLGLLLITVQNFTALDRRSLKIPWGKDLQ